MSVELVVVFGLMAACGLASVAELVTSARRAPTPAARPARSTPAPTDDPFDGFLAEARRHADARP